MLFSCQTRFMRQGVLRKLLRVMAFAIPYCFDSVPLLYRSVSLSASAVCPYCTGQYSLLLQQCALIVQVTIPYCFNSVPLFYKSVCPSTTCTYRKVSISYCFDRDPSVQASIPHCFDCVSLGFVYIRAKANAKAIFFFDVCNHCCRCSINTQIGNNTTG